jgi:hypothetical protein
VQEASTSDARDRFHAVESGQGRMKWKFIFKLAAMSDAVCRFCGLSEREHIHYGADFLCPPAFGTSTFYSPPPQFMKEGPTQNSMKLLQMLDQEPTKITLSLDSSDFHFVIYSFAALSLWRPALDARIREIVKRVKGEEMYEWYQKVIPNPWR